MKDFAMHALSARCKLGLAATATFVALGFAPPSARAQNMSPDAARPQTATARADAKQKAIPADANSTYVRDVLPIFMGKCSRCHNGEGMLYNWMNYKTAFGDRQEIKRRVWDSWKGKYFKQSMPAGSQEAQAMTEEERTIIKEWVEAGAAYGVASTDGSPKSKPERIEHGKRLFATVCALCHQPTGEGVPEKFPPLAGSDFLNSDKNRAIKILLHGRQGEITVNGRKFNNSMPSFPLGDEDIANALTFVYNSFGNSGKEVTPEEVKALRAEKEVAEAPGEPNQAVNVPREQSPFE